MAAFFGELWRVNRSTRRDNLKGVFGNFTFPWAMAAVGKVWREAGAEVGEARAERVGGLEW